MQRKAEEAAAAERQAVMQRKAEEAAAAERQAVMQRKAEEAAAAERQAVIQRKAEEARKATWQRKLEEAAEAERQITQQRLAAVRQRTADALDAIVASTRGVAKPKGEVATAERAVQRERETASRPGFIARASKVMLWILITLAFFVFIYFNLSAFINVGGFNFGFVIFKLLSSLAISVALVVRLRRLRKARKE
jgi:hypothetical protein